MTTDDIIKQRISDEKSKIKVDSYQDIAADGAWKAAGRALWSVAIIGAATGMFIGAVAVMSTMIAGVSLATAASALPAAIAGFGALGMSAGFAGGLMWGRASGAAASTAKEQERRIKEFMVENTLSNDPQAAIAQTKNTPPKKPETLNDTLTYVF